MIVTDPTSGQQANVFVRQTIPGFIDAVVRCKDQATWEAVAEANGLLVADENGNLHPNAGIEVDVLGPVVKTAAVMDGMTVVTPAVIDERYHVNFRMRSDIAWEALAIAWTNGTVDPNPNASEVAKVLYDIALIDPATIKSASRVWL